MKRFVAGAAVVLFMLLAVYASVQALHAGYDYGRVLPVKTVYSRDYRMQITNVLRDDISYQYSRRGWSNRKISAVLQAQVADDAALPPEQVRPMVFVAVRPMLEARGFHKPVKGQLLSIAYMEVPAAYLQSMSRRAAPNEPWLLLGLEAASGVNAEGGVYISQQESVRYYYRYLAWQCGYYFLIACGCVYAARHSWRAFRKMPKETQIG